MNNDDNGFNKAQREYDNQMPPEDDATECDCCDGTGEIAGMSNCCGAPTDDDTLICSDCKEHCDLAECDQCDGTGYVPMIEAKRKAYEEYCERKADEERDEDIGVRKIGSNIDEFLKGKIEE